MASTNRRRSSPTVDDDANADNGERVALKQKIGYGLGHVQNDLCASMWFTYLLLFFHKVLQFDNFYSGVILLAGQLADGVSTLFVGYFSDQDDDFGFCAKYGKRKSWHLVGTLCVLCSFPFVFLPCVDCSETLQQDQLVYYFAFVIIFQFGWAATQISHLSLIPDLTPLTDQRTSLTATRYAMTVVSNITIYVVTWIVLGTKTAGDGLVGPDDAGRFRDIMIVAVTLGELKHFHFSSHKTYIQFRQK